MTERTWQDTLNRDDVKRLQEVLEDRSDALLCLTSADGIVRWGSPGGALAILGRHPDDYVGKLGLDYVHPHDLDRVAAALARAIATGESQSMTYRAMTADDRWVELRTVTWTVDGEGAGPLLVAISVPADGTGPMPVAYSSR